MEAVDITLTTHESNTEDVLDPPDTQLTNT